MPSDILGEMRHCYNLAQQTGFYEKLKLKNWGKKRNGISKEMQIKRLYLFAWDVTTNANPNGTTKPGVV